VISTTKITQCDSDASRRRAHKQHATVTTTLQATSHGDSDCWEVGVAKQ